MTLELNTEYVVTHARKGRFRAIVTSVDPEWPTLRITAGAAVGRNKRHDVGEELTVRASLCEFIRYQAPAGTTRPATADDIGPGEIG